MTTGSSERKWKTFRTGATTSQWVLVPHIVERYHRTRGKQKAPTEEKVTVRLDADIVAHFREGGKRWQTRLNNTLCKAVLGG